MTFRAILSCIMILYIDLYDIGGHSRGIFGVTQRTKIPALRNPYRYNRIRGIDMLKPRTVTGFAGKGFVYVRRLQVGYVLMTIRASLLAGIFRRFGLIFNQGQPSVMAEFTK